jgi:uncharacterized protein (DUF4213/DUF364 family)
MITNRTQYDIDTAIDIIKEKVKKFQELTESDIDILERGTMTINTLNRIENKQEELKNLFNEMGYWNTDIKNKSWDYTQIFNIDEFQRILDNTNVLREAFFVYSHTPNTPKISYHYNDINALEKILNDLDVMINNIKSNYKICGVDICENS